MSFFPELVKDFPELSPKQIVLLEKFGLLFLDWNQKINLISRKETHELYTRHIKHSLAIAKYKRFLPGEKIMDLGCGGGFPGIPLAIFFPNCNFYLVDSIAKKINAVEQICEELDLKNVECMHLRAEDFPLKLDYVVTRAVAKSDKLIGWTSKIIKKNPKKDHGIICLKGGDLEEELSGVKKKYKQINISEYFDEDFFETKKIIHLLT